MPWSPDRAHQVLGHTFLGSPGTPVATVWAALCTSIGSQGLSVAEISFGAYARQRIVFGAPAARKSTNINSFAYPAATTPWGDIPHLAFYDAASGGNLLAFGTLPNTKTIVTSCIVFIGIGSITYRVDN